MRNAGPTEAEEHRSSIKAARILDGEQLANVDGARLGRNQENEGWASAACREVARIVTHNRMLALVCSRCQPLAAVARNQGLSCKARRARGREKRPGR